MTGRESGDGVRDGERERLDRNGTNYKEHELASPSLTPCPKKIQTVFRSPQVDQQDMKGGEEEKKKRRKKRENRMLTLT